MFPSPFARRFGIVSAPFATNNTVTKGTKLPESRTVIRKLSFALRPRRLIFDYCGAIFALPEAFFFGYCGAFFALPGAFSLVTAVRFSDGQGVLSIDYSGSKYARFTPKIAAMQKSLFRVVENGKFLNRLRNGHLEKSAATGLFCA